MTDQLISIVVPTRDSGRCLAKTLESVAAQTFANHEIILVVGGFDPALAIAGDTDWFARIQDRRIATHALPETLYFQRLHAGNLSHGPVSRQAAAA